MNIPSPTAASPASGLNGVPVATLAGLPVAGGNATAGPSFGAALTAFAAALDASTADPAGPAANPAANPIPTGIRIAAGVSQAAAGEPDGQTVADEPPPAAKRGPSDDDSVPPAIALYFAGGPIPAFPAAPPAITSGTADTTASVLTMFDPGAAAGPVAPAGGRSTSLGTHWSSPTLETDPIAPQFEANGIGVGLSARPGAAPTGVGQAVSPPASPDPRPADAAVPAGVFPKADSAIRPAFSRADGPRADRLSPVPTPGVAIAAENADAGPATAAHPPSDSSPAGQIQQEKNADLAVAKAVIPQGPGGSSATPAPDNRQLTIDNPAVNPSPLTIGIAGASSPDVMRKSTGSPVAEPVGRNRSLDATAGIRELLAANAPQGPGPSVNHAGAVDAPAAPPSAFAHAIAAIEATVEAVNHARIAGHSSVELKLSFGDATQLAVRVELRDGAVHTTFRTDSAELRNVLAREWTTSAPAITAASRDHTLRLADPVFDRATPDLGTTGSSTGGQSQPREMPTPEPDAAQPTFAPTRAGAVSDQPPAAVATAIPNGSTLLNTFA